MNKRTKDALISAAIGAGIVFLVVPGTWWLVSSKVIGSEAQKKKAQTAGAALKRAAS